MSRASQSSEGGALALRDRNVEEVRKLIGRAAGAVKKLVGDATAERFLRAATAHYIHADKPEDMLIVEPSAYIASVMDAARDGLLPDGRDGWIIPYKRDCDWRPSWRGLLKLARRATTLRDVSAEVVYTSDVFDLTLGSNRQIEHVPYYARGIAAADRGQFVGVYAGCRIGPSWSYEFRFVDAHRIDQVMRMSGNPFNDVPSPVWEKHHDQMSMKHAFRKLCDWIEVPDSVLDVMLREDERDDARRARVKQEDGYVDKPRPLEDGGSKLAGEIRGTEA